MSYEAYAKSQRTTSDARDVEYRAFVTSTRALIAAGEGEGANLAEALHINRSLWEALAADCANTTNQLPVETRAQIIGLSRWVSTYSRKVLRSQESVDALIDVNRIMMDGLAGREAATPETA